METDTFANNRLSLILHSKNPVRHALSHHVNEGAKGASLLCETLKDQEYPEHAPVMYTNNKEGVTGTFFDWMKQEVRKCSICVQLNRLMYSRTLDERCVAMVLLMRLGLHGFSRSPDSCVLPVTCNPLVTSRSEFPLVLVQSRAVRTLPLTHSVR